MLTVEHMTRASGVARNTTENLFTCIARRKTNCAFEIIGTYRENHEREDKCAMWQCALWEWANFIHLHQYRMAGAYPHLNGLMQEAQSP